MQVVRGAARLIAWVFVAAIGYHAVLAAGDAVEAARDGRWAHAAGYGAIALFASGLVVGAILYARASRARVRRPRA